jgi:hypothetical protein
VTCVEKLIMLSRSRSIYSAAPTLGVVTTCFSSTKNVLLLHWEKTQKEACGYAKEKVLKK